MLQVPAGYGRSLLLPGQVYLSDWSWAQPEQEAISLEGSWRAGARRPQQAQGVPTDRAAASETSTAVRDQREASLC